MDIRWRFRPLQGICWVVLYSRIFREVTRAQVPYAGACKRIRDVGRHSQVAARFGLRRIPLHIKRRKIRPHPPTVVQAVADREDVAVKVQVWLVMVMYYAVRCHTF
jgi:hypothetical protein